MKKILFLGLMLLLGVENSWAFGFWTPTQTPTKTATPTYTFTPTVTPTQNPNTSFMTFHDQGNLGAGIQDSAISYDAVSGSPHKILSSVNPVDINPQGNLSIGSQFGNVLMLSNLRMNGHNIQQTGGDLGITNLNNGNALTLGGDGSISLSSIATGIVIDSAAAISIISSQATTIDSSQLDLQPSASGSVKIGKIGASVPVTLYGNIVQCNASPTPTCVTITAP